jgi:hypothetical protein
MRCIKLKSVTGTERLIPVGKPYTKQPDEDLLPGVWDCENGQASLKNKPTPSLAQELNSEIGSGMGDWIKVVAKPVASLVGKQNCSPCEAKRIIVNAYGRLKARHGKLKAISIMKDLWQMSAAGKPEEALAQLKEQL